MRYRAVASLGVLLVAIAVMAVTTRSIAGQASAARAKAPAATKKWTVPRTPDGQPDIHGYWTNSSYTPVERANNEAKVYYTP